MNGTLDAWCQAIREIELRYPLSRLGDDSAPLAYPLRAWGIRAFGAQLLKHWPMYKIRRTLHYLNIVRGPAFEREAQDKANDIPSEDYIDITKK